MDPLPTAGLHGPLLHYYGGIFTGTLLSAICFGAISLQMMRYFDVFHRDPLPIRAVVAFLWLVGASQLACITQSLWYYFIQNYGNEIPLLDSTWELSWGPIGDVMSSAAVETFFAYRVYSFSNSIALGVLVELFALVQCGFGIAVSIAVNRFPVSSVFVKKYTWLMLTWLACQAAADLVICTAMVVLLRKRRSGFRDTDKILNIMALWTVNTGVLTALLSVLTLITYTRTAFQYIVPTVILPLGGIYTFTMMANLHSRTTIAERWDRFHHVSTGRQFSRPWTAFRPAKEKKQQPDAYELSRLAVKAESDMPLPQAATLPPMRVATRTTDPTVTLNDDEVGSGTGTTPKRSVEIGVTESVVGTTPIASTASAEQRRLSNTVIIKYPMGDRRNRLSVDGQDEIDSDVDDHPAQIPADGQNNT